MKDSSKRSAVQTPKALHAIRELRREAVESYIEQLIALLDTLDGDADLEENGDLEPSIGSQGRFGSDRIEYDLEGDTSDDELSLGWSNPMGLRAHVPEEAARMMSAFDGGDA
jgi:hypothetical protein